jgi:hypothetical protein
MARFYQIARLAEGKTIFPETERLRIDLDRVTREDLIENDVAFQAAIAPRSWFWLSGGGTILLNGHYLPIVRRSAGARVNPGKFSLFTGRADDAQERANPTLLVRELFEELLLFEGETLLVPQCEEFQHVIEKVRGATGATGVLKDGPQRPLPLTAVPLKTRPVEILHQGVEREYQLSWTVGPSKDINVLYLFTAECDLKRLSARDGEFDVSSGRSVGAGRDIYLYDLRSRAARALTCEVDQQSISRAEMTDPLRFLEDLIV